jgi:hypothetical protein
MSRQKALFSGSVVGHRSGLFLVWLLGYYVFVPYIGWFGNVLPVVDAESFQVLLFMGILLTGIRAVSEDPRHFRIGLAIGVPTMVVDWVAYFIPSPALHVVIQGAYLLFVAYVGVRIFGYVLAPGEVNPDRMFAAISVYVLMGLGFALVFGIVESLQPGSFSGLSEGAARHSVELLYYSLVTLTTLGYGEITPVAPQVRSLATIEAMMGVFYVAILVARLVALYSHSQREDR